MGRTTILAERRRSARTDTESYGHASGGRYDLNSLSPERRTPAAPLTEQIRRARSCLLRMLLAGKERAPAPDQHEAPEADVRALALAVAAVHDDARVARGFARYVLRLRTARTGWHVASGAACGCSEQRRTVK